ncbi:MAG TPA: NUDIX hydrolase [Actinomycetota bacterium]|nr:NUDIX hydrolase [Actinomycetota bacterium]
MVKDRDGELIRAAGGVVLRSGSAGRTEVAVVHRPAYDDWSLPKGKLHPGEGLEEAALREVEEETGFRARLGRRIGDVEYLDRKGRPKRVTYWLMEPVDGAFRPTDEVDQLRWVPVEDAADVLSRQLERDVLARATAEIPQ